MILFIVVNKSSYYIINGDYFKDGKELIKWQKEEDSPEEEYPEA